jgi:hypothetical protein
MQADGQVQRLAIAGGRVVRPAARQVEGVAGLQDDVVDRLAGITERG